MEILILGTGSSGNCSLVKNHYAALLVDAGLPSRTICSRLAEENISPDQLAGILLTHEHTDHAGGLKVFLRRHQVPLYCNAETLRALGGSAAFPGAEIRIFETGASFDLAGFNIRSFSVPHDAGEPVGFRIEHDGLAFGFLTDLGFATRLVLETLRGVHGLLVEANYDETMLQNDTKRPWSVKQRITSRHGHLSNRAASQVVAEVVGRETQHVVLGHLSRDCNKPEIALHTVMEKITPHQGQSKFTCSLQDVPLKLRLSR